MGRISEQEAQQHYTQSSNSEWFTLKNHGDVARIQFLQNTVDDLEIYACHKVQINGKDRYVDCIRNYNDPIDDCPLCAAGIPVKPVRFVTMYDLNDKKVKIWERGKQFISKLEGLMSRYAPLSEHVFEIERNGAAGDKETKYEIYPMERVEPVDLSEVEVPELLGTLILSKTPEEMDYYLANGTFPSTDGEVQPTTPGRTSTGTAPTSRRGGAPVTSRRGSSEQF